MPTFQYIAKQGPSQTVEGIVDADTYDHAVTKVINLGYSPVDVYPYVESKKKVVHKNKAASALFAKHLSFSELVSFTRQMSDLIEASVPVLRALSLILSQTTNQHLKDLVEKMYMAVKDGSSLSAALAQHPKEFSSFYTNLVKTGEVSGKLDIVMKRLADYLEKEQDIRSKVRSALAYPTLVMVIGFLTIFVLLSFVVPRLTMIFDDLGQNLPVPTIILMKVSTFFAQWWWLIIMGGGVLFFYFRRWSKTESGQFFIDSLILRLPILGNFIRVVEVARFSRTLATLVETGIVITSALNSVWSTVQNIVLQQEIRNVSDAVSNGSSLRKALEGSGFFPPMAVNMIAVGEETGQLEKSLYKIADTYEREVSEQMKLLLSLLGPLALVVIVIFVGFVVMALLLPVFQMNLIVQ